MTCMRRMGTCVASALAIAGLAAGSASAAALTLETAAGPLAPGAGLVFSSSNMTLTKADGSIECTSTVLTGTLTNNGLAKDAGAFGEAALSGTEIGGACKDTDPFGRAQMTTVGLPWSEVLTSKGLGTMKGTKKIVFHEIQPQAEGAACDWEASKVNETFAQHRPISEALVIEVHAQLFKRNKKTSNPSCPSSGLWSGSFTVQSGGETVLAHT